MKMFQRSTRRSISKISKHIDKEALAEIDEEFQAEKSVIRVK